MGHLVLMRDLNERVGRDVESWGEVIERHGEEKKKLLKESEREGSGVKKLSVRMVPC